MFARPKAPRALLVLAASVFVAGAAIPAAAHADTEDPSTCSTTVSYDPSIKTWGDYFADNHNPQAVKTLGGGTTGAGGGASAYGITNDAANPTVARGRNLNSVLLEYADYLTQATATSGRVRILKKVVGTSSLGRPINFYVVGTPGNINNLDGANGDAAYWRSVREGDVSIDDANEQAVTRPAFGWITATPHGDESAAGESIAREMYELAARTDCANVRRISNMDLFLQLVRNPDGHDAVTRTTAWAFDPNRDFGTRNQPENSQFIPLINEYPGLFFIDAHQQGGSAYFFPPNEDPVHHEITDFSLSTIQGKIGPALQNAFNNQSELYQNYNTYDLFTPEYGDTVPSLIMGAAGMTYEKGNAEIYSKQVYDHYLAIDSTINVISNDKVNTTRDWIQQWDDPTPDPAIGGQPAGAIEQGAECDLQPNRLVSPLHDQLTQIPSDKKVCGYFYRPDRHTGDVASLLTNLQQVGVKVYKLNSDTTLNGVQDYGQTAGTATLPAGTLYIPMAQGQKHWIEAVLGENPYIPYPFYYDVVTWSYGLQRGLAGDGYLTDKTSVPTDMTLVGASDLGGAPATASNVYAFNTDSMQGLGLVTDLLSKGVNVYRATTAFDAGGKHYFTGAALVDGASLASSGADLNALSKTRQTPVAGLTNYPAPHQQMTAPKIGVYTGTALIPSNPLYVSGTGIIANAAPGHCAVGGNSSFCEALFTLRVKDNLPASSVVPVTSTDIQNGLLISGGFTALINGQTIAAGAAAGDQVKAFVNAGGRYVGYTTAGATSARNAGLSNINTNTRPSTMQTPGSTFDATFDTSDPVAWGFDLGGWIYRSSNNDPLFDPTTLAAGVNPASTAPVTYAANQGDGQKYGLSIQAVNTGGATGLLNSRPFVVSSSLGAGHSTVIGNDPFYRAWKEQDERLVLNAALYPTGAVLPADPAPAKGDDTAPTAAEIAAAPTAPTQAKTKEAAAPLPKAKLPKTKITKTITQHDSSKDLQITVLKKYAPRLKLAIKAAKLPLKVRKNVSYKTGKTLVYLTIKNARGADFHTREEWENSLMKQIKLRKINMYWAAL